MEPKILEKGSMMLAGMVNCGRDAGEVNIGGLWEAFEANEEELRGMVEGVGYELHMWHEHAVSEEKQHFCLVGVELTMVEKVPMEFFVKVLPATRYAVYTHSFKDGGYGEAFDKAYQWLDSSGFTRAFHYDIQVYDSRFKGGENPDSVYDIYLPIQ